MKHMHVIIFCIIALNLFCAGMMFYTLRQQPPLQISRLTQLKLGFSGILSSIADTVGIGGFAVNIALAKCFNTFEDDELPAVNNGAQVIPGMLESLFFMQLIPVDLTTLVTLVCGACLGGVLGAHVMSHLNKQAVRLTMICCFSGMIALLLVDLLDLMPITATLTALHSWKLVIGFFALTICGALTTVGIGLFAMVQAVLFMLGVSPVVAFPIMTTAGAMQQPLSTLVFLKQNKIPLKKTLTLSVIGCLGVFIALPIVSHMNTAMLHTLLVMIICFNLVRITQDYWRAKRATSPSMDFIPEVAL
jgi:uncharacterized membrane protein YfcA